MKVSTKTIKGRQFTIYKSEKREIRIAFVEKNSCGDPLGWYFTVFGPELHPAGVDSRWTNVWYSTQDAALNEAKKV